MVKRKVNLSPIIFLIFLIFSCGEMVHDDSSLEKEIEPNGDEYNATPMTLGKIYTGKISSKTTQSDRDIFSFYGIAGTIYTVEFETDNSDFEPFISVTSTLDNIKHAIFNSGEKDKFEFFFPFDTKGYVVVGDYRNLEEGVDPFGSDNYKYWVRVTSRHICDEEIESKLTESNKLSYNFDDMKGTIKTSKIQELDGYYGIKVNSENPKKDKKLILFDCIIREVHAGNDDIDIDSEDLDPYIYEKFSEYRDLAVVIDKWLVNFTFENSDIFTVDMIKQEDGKEFEPNNTFQYATHILGDSITGYLEKEDMNIQGMLQPDLDYFQKKFPGGYVVNLDTEFVSDGSFTSRLWGYSFGTTGYSIIPLKANAISGKAGERHIINTYMPFTGTLYYELQGRDTSYSFDISTSPVEETLPASGSVEVLTDKCQTHFFNYEFPQDAEKVKISAKIDGEEIDPGIYIFGSNSLPFIYLEPEENNYFYMLDRVLSGSIVIGLFSNECSPDDEKTITVTTEEIPLTIEETDFVKYTQVAVEEGKSYLGYFETDIELIKNTFIYKAEQDGTLYLSTSEYPDNESHPVDTVLSVFREDYLIDSNDDMIEMLQYNPYSFVRINVTEGKEYRIEVMPFMSESSHTPSMNIKANYILDINLN